MSLGTAAIVPGHIGRGARAQREQARLERAGVRGAQLWVRADEDERPGPSKASDGLESRERGQPGERIHTKLSHGLKARECQECRQRAHVIMSSLSTLVSAPSPVSEELSPYRCVNRAGASRS